MEKLGFFYALLAKNYGMPKILRVFSSLSQVFLKSVLALSLIFCNFEPITKRHDT